VANSITKEELAGLSAESGVNVVRPLRPKPSVKKPVAPVAPPAPKQVKPDYKELVAAINHQTKTLSELSANEDLTQIIDELRETNARLLATVQNSKPEKKQPFTLSVKRDMRGLIESVVATPGASE